MLLSQPPHTYNVQKFPHTYKTLEYANKQKAKSVLNVASYMECQVGVHVVKGRWKVKWSLFHVLVNSMLKVSEFIKKYVCQSQREIYILRRTQWPTAWYKIHFNKKANSLVSGAKEKKKTIWFHFLYKKVHIACVFIFYIYLEYFIRIARCSLGSSLPPISC